ncbi:MAG: DNA mismatch repair protein MutS [Pyrinomonadaceae bacterium]|nr:DNA mismatch repair protein MutS [Pyrinomonadaceae bacterium]
MKSFRKVGVLRLTLLATGLVLAWPAFKGLVAWWWLLPVVVVFFALAQVQARITQARRRCERAAALYEQGLARLDDRWAGKGATGERFLKSTHPYAEDLDLFGHGSLFELLSTARTRAGEETLASWLLAPAAPEVVRARQAAVAELRPRLDLREDLLVLGEDVRSGEDSQGLAAWAAATPWDISRSMRVVAFALALLAVVTLILWIAGWGWIPFLVALILGRSFAFRLAADVQRVIGAVDGPGRDLALLSQVLRRLEREQFSSPRLVEVRAALDVEGLAPSRQIAQLNRLIDLLDARRNMMFAPLAALLLWPLQLAFVIERWRQRSGPAVARWLAAVGELEALTSLAGYSYEHPQDPFPELAEGEGYFEGEGLGHPLIPEGRNVRTDLRLSDEPRVLVISGSNMSGKSTLLRTVGTNTVMALAGAPVRARRLRLSAMEVGASIRIQDSLQAGASRFYAEITRLRQIVELTKKALPVLFLLDEILHGTNSHDRLIGAEGVVKGLIERGAIGMVTTHDLALARIAEELAPRAANVHFEDHLEGGKITFDYRLRPGVVQRSNALELMRSVGLEV